VNLGSGVEVPVETNTKKVHLHQAPRKVLAGKKMNYPDIPQASSTFIVDGEEYRVERNVIRYDTLDSIMDDLPDFIQDILNK